MIALESLGWCSFFQEQISQASDPTLLPARVLEDQGRFCRVHTGRSEVLAVVPGRLLHGAVFPEALPVAGDWVQIQPRDDARRGVVTRVLHRRTRLARAAAGEKAREQVLAANVDTVLVIQSLDGDFNPRRLERYLVTVRQGGARPVVVLNKVDRCADSVLRAAEAESIAGDAPVHLVCALDGRGLADVTVYLGNGRTVALVGSSGVGKSTLLNRLAGASLQRVRQVREADGRGRHVTTARRLVLLDRGGMVLDTPGLRELGLWSAAPGLEATFSDIEALARGCRFRDCAHQAEPDCAVRAALADGSLDPRRWESHGKLKREAEHAAAKHDAVLRRERTLRWRRIHRAMRR